MKPLPRLIRLLDWASGFVWVYIILAGLALVVSNLVKR